MPGALPILAALLALLALTGCDAAPRGPRVTVEHAMVVLPVLPGRPGAAYFTLRADHPARLEGIASPRIPRIELHQTVSEGGIARMRRLQRPEVRSGEPLTFAPGGRHAMLFDVDPALRPGEQVRLTFTFDAAPPVTVEAPVAAFGSEGHRAH